MTNQHRPRVTFDPTKKLTNITTKKPIKLVDFHRAMREVFESRFCEEQEVGICIFEKTERMVKMRFSLEDKALGDSITLLVCSNVGDLGIPPQVVLRVDIAPVMDLQDALRLHKALAHVGSVAKAIEGAIKDTHVVTK